MDQIDPNIMCCAALELSQSKWLCAVRGPADGKGVLRAFPAGHARELIEWLHAAKKTCEAAAGRGLSMTLCYEAGYDGFWLARLLPQHGIRTVVFDPASFLKPRRGRLAKTDRLDAEEMTRILRAWLGGDTAVAREVQVPSVEAEDAKRLSRERKHLVNERTRLIGRLKGLCALHGITTGGKMISKRWANDLETQVTGDGRPLPPLLRAELGRLLRRLDFLAEMLAEVEGQIADAVAAQDSPLPDQAKAQRLVGLRGVGVTSAVLLVSEVFQRRFETRRHLASFLGLAPCPHASGDVSRDRGISKAGCKIARQTMVELAWSWIRYQPASQLAQWWKTRYAGQGLRARKIGIVALARKLAIALWRFVEHGEIPEGATMKP